MKIRRMRLKGNIAVYVMILFGLITSMYLCGFESPWSSYISQSIGENTTLGEQPSDDIMTMMMDSVYSFFEKAGEEVGEHPWEALLGGIIAVTSVVGLALVGGGYVLTYLIPIGFLFVFANLFLFPTADMTGSMPQPLGLIVAVFLNLFLILTLLSFVRGNE